MEVFSLFLREIISSAFCLKHVFYSVFEDMLKYGMLIYGEIFRYSG